MLFDVLPNLSFRRRPISQVLIPKLGVLRQVDQVQLKRIRLGLLGRYSFKDEASAVDANVEFRLDRTVQGKTGAKFVDELLERIPCRLMTLLQGLLKTN